MPAPKTVEEPAQKQRQASLGVKLARRDSARRGQGLQQITTKEPAPVGKSLHPVSPDSPAEPPNVPRLNAQRHLRKRSNTNPTLPPPSLSTGLRSFPSNTVGSSMISVLPRRLTSGSSNKKPFSLHSNSDSRNTSMTSSDQPNLFEAMGTVRMEAFMGVGPRQQDDNDTLDEPCGSPIVPMGSMRRRGNSILSSSTADTTTTTGVSFGFDYRERDPFGGF